MTAPTLAGMDVPGTEDETAMATDPEVAAMSVIATVLARLDPVAQARVIQWAFSRYVAMCPLDLRTRPDEDEIVGMAAAWASDVLDMLDPQALQQAALEGLGMGDDGDVTRPLLDGIKAAWRVAARTAEARELWPST